MERNLVLAALLDLFGGLGFAKKGACLAVGVEEELQTALVEDPTRGEGALELVRGLVDITEPEAIKYDGGLPVAIERDRVIMTTDAGRRQIEFIYDPVTHLRDFAGVQSSTRRLAVEMLAERGYVVLGTGYHPWAQSTFADWVPKQRYRALVEALNPAVLRSADTAGLQATVDTRSVGHMLEVANVFNLAAPIIAALTANSPLHDGVVEPQNKGLRHFTWNNLAPPERRGIKHFASIEEYLEWVIDMPVLLKISPDGFAERPRDPTAFWQWALPAIEAGNIKELKWRFNVHTACSWPEARIRPFNRIASVEGRTPCAQPHGAATSVVALYLGLAENSAEALDVLSQFSVMDLIMARTPCAKLGLEAVIDGRDVPQVALELLDVAKRGLVRRGQSEDEELDLLYIRATDRRTPADALIDLARESTPAELLKALSYAA